MSKTGASPSKSKACKAATSAPSSPAACQLRLESLRTTLRRPEPGRYLPATHDRRKETRRRPEVRNILLICHKEIKSYFASPIAYLLMAFFGLIFGFGFFRSEEHT